MKVTYKTGYNSSDGISFEIYLSGCNRTPKCKNCHNPLLWDFNYGKDLNYKKLNKLIKYSKFDNFVILGGEPLDQNSSKFNELILYLKKNYPKIPIWLYTSYELKDIPKHLLLYVNYIKTNKYEEKLRTNNNIHFGVKLASSNQKIYQILK